MVQGASYYGIGIRAVSSTAVNVNFQGQGRAPTNGTYAGNGSAWSTLSGGVSRWRIRKISGGASVGFPVSARNVVGDTSGTAVPSGYVGEVKYAYGSSSTSAASSSGAVLSLGPGIWLCSAQCNISGTGPSKANLSIGTSGGTVIGLNPQQGYWGDNATIGRLNVSGLILNVTTTASINVAISHTLSASANIDYYTQAVRIA